MIELRRIEYKRRKNRNFDYQPVFYDPDKERLESKKKLYSNQDSKRSQEEIRASIKSGFIRGSFQQNDNRLKQFQEEKELLRFIRIILIAGILTYILYAIIYYKLIDKLTYFLSKLNG